MRGWFGLILVVVTTAACGGLSGIAFGLPEGRVYEMVSPTFKGGYGVSGGGIVGVAPDGESVALGSVGAFAGLLVNMPLGNQYISHRNPSGWSTSALDPPATRALPEGSQTTYDLDFSPTLTAKLWTGCLSANLDLANECQEVVLLEHNTNAPNTGENWQQIGTPIILLEKHVVLATYESASPDFCHVLVSVGTLVEAAENTKAELYDLSTGCTGSPGPHLVGLDNKGNVLDPYCIEALGGGGGTLNAVASGGQEIFFTTNVGLAEKEVGCNKPVATNPRQLFVRLDGTRTLEVSRPLGPGAFGGCGDGGKVGEVEGEVPCPGAAGRPASSFWGASEDGSKVYFTTAGPLVEGQVDSTRNLYEATIGCIPQSTACAVSEREVVSLAQVSKSSLPSETANVRGVVKISPDGSHVAFVAGGVLTEESGAGGRVAEKGADNLYVYDDTTGQIRFVADLCSGPGKSGTAPDARCPAELKEAPGSPDEPESSEGNDTLLWHQGQETKESQFNICERNNPAECTDMLETGRFLVFASYGQLSKTDTDDARDIYRFDMTTGALVRVSGGEGGYGANGNCIEPVGESICDATIVPIIGIRNREALYAQHEMVDRALTENGARIVFSTRAQLSPVASNGLEDVYEWHEAAGQNVGEVSIVSTGNSLTGDQEPVLTPAGRDLFFSTSQGLVRADTDGQADVYDARLGGGFPPGPVEQERCSGDACQGPLTDPAPLLVPGSVVQTPGGNFSPTAVKAVAKKVVKASVRPKRSRNRKRTGRALHRANKTGGRR